MALTASYTADWTMAISRVACGGGTFAATAMSPALTLQSVITSAPACCDMNTQPHNR